MRHLRQSTSGVASRAIEPSILKSPPSRLERPLKRQELERGRGKERVLKKKKRTKYNNDAYRRHTMSARTHTTVFKGKKRARVHRRARARTFLRPYSCGGKYFMVPKLFSWRPQRIKIISMIYAAMCILFADHHRVRSFRFTLTRLLGTSGFIARVVSRCTSYVCRAFDHIELWS